MLRRGPCTFQMLSLTALVVAAALLAACGGGFEADTVTGVSALPEPQTAAEENGATTFVTRDDGDDDDEGDDHDGEDGDDDGEDGDGEDGDDEDGDDDDGEEDDDDSQKLTACPCFSEADLQAAAGQCNNGTVTPTCSVSPTAVSLLLACDPGGTVPPRILGLYLTQLPAGGFCQRTDVFGSFSQAGLTPAEYRACADALTTSGFCF